MRQEPKVLKVRLVTQVHKVQLVLEAQQELKVLLVTREPKELQERQEPQVHKVLWVIQVRKVLEVVQVLQEPKVP